MYAEKVLKSKLCLYGITWIILYIFIIINKPMKWPKASLRRFLSQLQAHFFLLSICFISINWKPFIIAVGVLFGFFFICILSTTLHLPGPADHTNSSPWGARNAPHSHTLPTVQRDVCSMSVVI